MKFFRSIIALTAVFALFVSAVPPAQAAIHFGSVGNSSPRGFKRSISRARDVLKTTCIHEKNANDRRTCMQEYRKSIRGLASPIKRNYVEHNTEQRGERCGILPTTQERRACIRDAQANIPQGNQRVYNKRTRSRAAKNRRDECRGKETTNERLQCLRGSSSTRRTQQVTHPARRNRLSENTPVDFISPQGLRRNLSRSRDLIKEKCGDIVDGNDKRVCIKNIQNEYQGY